MGEHFAAGSLDASRQGTILVIRIRLSVWVWIGRRCARTVIDNSHTVVYAIPVQCSVVIPNRPDGVSTIRREMIA